jgi:hydroxyacylglutathione hydrolase
MRCGQLVPDHRYLVPVAGHTAGSCVVLLDDGDAVVGDQLRGGFAFARIRPHHPERHFFAEDVASVRGELIWC